MNQIKHVYFDVGGVAILDFSGTNKWTSLKRDLGITPEMDKEYEAVWSKHQNRICIDYDVDNIIPELKSSLNIKLTPNYSMLADFVNRFEPNPSIWPVIKAAQTKYAVGLLTNMYPRMLDAIISNSLLPDIDWDAVVDSSLVGFQKPEPGIYQIAEQVAGVAPESIFFIDNSQEHLDAASKRGWQTLLYNPQQPKQSSREVAKKLELNVEIKNIL